MIARSSQQALVKFGSMVLIAACALFASCGGDDETQQDLIRGKVIDGYIDGAIVCLDANDNGRCEEPERTTISGSGGLYELPVPAGSTGPLLAEIRAGQARDSDRPDAAVDASFRMASPSSAYSTDITPFTTLVHLYREPDLALAEDLVRNDLGLPPKFGIRLSAAAEAGSLTHAVAKAVVTALKAAEPTLDMAGADGLKTVVASFPPALTELPQLAITTKDGAPITSKEVYIDATFKLTQPVVSALPYELKGKIRGRGQSTWGQPKNPYKVQFSNDAAYAKVPDFLGMKKNRNWALLADYFDRSLIRNKLALSLGASSIFSDGLKWTPSGQHLEVWLNGDYVGVYLMTEDIRIDPARLNIRKMSSKAADNDIDGGYLVEVDSRLDCYKGDDVDMQLVMPTGEAICIDTPDEESITPAQVAYVKGLLRQASSELWQDGRITLLNPPSYADWYLIQELLRNNDAVFVSSDWMWKDTEAAADPRDRLLNMGPLWDFDRAAGNVNYNDNWMTEGCWVTRPIFYGNWFSRIFDNRDFLELTLARWKAKRPALERFVNASIDCYARRLGQAQQRNFARWPIFGTTMTNYYVFANHAEEIAFVKRFLNERIAWLDRAYASPESFVSQCGRAAQAAAGAAN
jgi:hypothetical protein